MAPSRQFWLRNAPADLYALTYPDRFRGLKVSGIELRHLDFEAPCDEEISCMALADEAVEAGGGKDCGLERSG